MLPIPGYIITLTVVLLTGVITAEKECCKLLNELAACESERSCIWVAGNTDLFVTDIYCRSERWIECRVCELDASCIMPDHCNDGETPGCMEPFAESEVVKKSPVELDGNVCCKDFFDIFDCASGGVCVWVANSDDLFLDDIYCRGERWIECKVCELEGDSCIMPDHCTETGSHNCIEPTIPAEVIDKQLMAMSKPENVSIISYGLNVIMVVLLVCGLFGYALYWKCNKIATIGEVRSVNQDNQSMNNYDSCV